MKMAGCDCSASSQKREASKEGILRSDAEFELVLQRCVPGLLPEALRNGTSTSGESLARRKAKAFS